MKLQTLKNLINEAGFPYFDDTELLSRLDEAEDIYSLARELCLIKAGIEEIKLGDITIPSPRKHFMMLAQKYRRNLTGVTVRADEC